MHRDKPVVSRAQDESRAGKTHMIRSSYGSTTSPTIKVHPLPFEQVEIENRIQQIPSQAKHKLKLYAEKVSNSVVNGELKQTRECANRASTREKRMANYHEEDGAYERVQLIVNKSNQIHIAKKQREFLNFHARAPYERAVPENQMGRSKRKWAIADEEASFKRRKLCDTRDGRTKTKNNDLIKDEFKNDAIMSKAADEEVDYEELEYMMQNMGIYETQMKAAKAVEEAQAAIARVEREIEEAKEAEAKVAETLARLVYIQQYNIMDVE
nr:hypothetical protein Iba_chr04cCG16640 [Ipomoea batatas]